jgi:hypothetical protein
MNKVGETTISDLKTYYKAIASKTVLYWYKNRHLDQENRTEISEISQWMYSQLILNKGIIAYIGEKRASSINGAGKTRYSHAED